ncbi:hypothetical protein [Paenibacillus kandeliae]|uniref:hypothetical protein n=1 Tax=Paenibacillus kandeliae TaxID=3231269 RepID=UPI00345A34C3
MAYEYQGFIGTKEVLSGLEAKYSSAQSVHLHGELYTVPFTPDLYDEIHESPEASVEGSVEGMDVLTATVEAICLDISLSGMLAYVEAEYFGGSGSQSCNVWHDGRNVLKELQTDQAFNQALRYLGVQRHDELDEFEQVQLARHRDTEEWLNLHS